MSTRHRTTQIIQVSAQKPKKSDVQRVKIIEAAVEVLAKSGLDGLTFESVGDLCGLKKAHVRYYFPEREQLIAGCLRYIIYTAQRYSEEAKSKAPTWQEGILEIVGASLKWTEDHPSHATVATMCQAIAALSGTFRDDLIAIRQKGLDRMTQLIQHLFSKNSPEFMKAVAYLRIIQFSSLGYNSEINSVGDLGDSIILRENFFEVVRSVISKIEALAKVSKKNASHK